MVGLKHFNTHSSEVKVRLAAQKLAKEAPSILAAHLIDWIAVHVLIEEKGGGGA